MRKFLQSGSYGTLIVLAGWAFTPKLFAQDIVAVLSSKSAPYMEALNGIKETVGSPVRVVDLTHSDRVPDQAAVIIAIGGKAATLQYPQDIPLIYCVAPSVFIKKEMHRGPLARVYLSPSPIAIVQHLKNLQPNLTRLAALWSNAEAVGHYQGIASEGLRLGITVTPVHLDSRDELPVRLRALVGHVDALWLAPDPALINPASFALMREFALSNDIPLYVTMDSLAGEGASAAIYVTFREMGHKAGHLVTQMMSGSASPSDDYGDQVQMTINATVAMHSGLTISATELKNADKVIP